MASEIFPLEMQNLTAIGICDFEDQAITMEELLQRYEARFQPKPNPLTLQHVRATVSDYLRRKERRQKDKPDLISLTRTLCQTLISIVKFSTGLSIISAMP